MNAYAGVRGNCFLVMVLFSLPSTIVNVRFAGVIGIMFSCNPLRFLTFVLVIFTRMYAGGKARFTIELFGEYSSSCLLSTILVILPLILFAMSRSVLILNVTITFIPTESIIKSGSPPCSSCFEP